MINIKGMTRAETIIAGSDSHDFPINARRILFPSKKWIYFRMIRIQTYHTYNSAVKKSRCDFSQEINLIILIRLQFKV